MPQLIDLNLLDGTTGFRIDGIANGDLLGSSVQVIGDINGDGFGELLIGAPSVDDGDAQNVGNPYIIFGQAAAFGAVFDLTTLDGTNGFALQSYDGGAQAGFSVSSGDINGDGFTDLILGAPANVDFGANDSGETFVFFGRDDTYSGFGALIDLAALDGTDGFIAGGGDTVGDDIGASVSVIGDVNGDGIDDFITGAPGLNGGAGGAFVVFGGDAGFPANVDLLGLNGNDGFALDGLVANDLTGASVSGADLNGDGVEDLIIGSPNADPNGGDSGEVRVIFGQTTPFAANVSIAALDGANGFTVSGIDANDLTGFSVANAGDVNGDGFDDMIVGAPNVYQVAGGYYGYEAGEAYVIFGTGAGFPADINVGALDGTNGFTIRDNAFGFNTRYGNIGSAVASAGDVNGDGFDDVIVGAEGQNRGFLVFGAANFAAEFDVDGIVDTTGAVLEGAPGTFNTGYAVGGGQDLNGDGFDDFSIGSPTLNEGSAFFVRGFDEGTATFVGGAADDNAVGNGGGDIAILGQGDDTFDGQGGADAISGGAGDDRAIVADLNFRQIDGGVGFDTLEVIDSLVTLDFTAAGDQNVSDVEQLDFSGTDNTVILDTLSVQQLSSTSNTVFIVGDATTTLQLADEADWVAVGATNAFVLLESQTGDAELAVSLDINFPAAFANILTTEVQLGTLDGADGFRIEGIGPDSEFGTFVSDAGDVNGDGFEDFIIGARYADNFYYNGGEAYIVFGTGDPFPASLRAEDLDGTNGFVISPVQGDARLGVTVGGAGDVNGDGFADVVIGSYQDFYNTGEAFVVFGADVDTGGQADLSALDGTNGFSIQGLDLQDRAGVAVDMAGDVNGDGFDDIIIGGVYADPGGRFRAGESYVVFGSDQGFAATINVGALDGNNGFRINGPVDYSYTGVRVASAGDINGDGFDDLQIIGSGSISVVLGSADPFPADFDLNGLAAADGFTIIGGGQANSINHAGDVNGDGIDDFVIGNSGADNGGTNTGSGFVVFGTAGGFGATLDLSTLDGITGFRVDGLADYSGLGGSIAGAGDVNGDGFDDLILGAPGVYQDGGGFQVGQSVVLFGSDANFGAVFDAATIDGTNGFLVTDAEKTSGGAVSSAGDVNGDGFDDLLVGAQTDPNAAGDASGAAYVVFGQDTGAVTQLGDENDNLLIGNGGDDVIVGGGGNDQLIGNGGADVFRGGEGADIIVVDDIGFSRIDGGTGFDVVNFLTADEQLDMTVPGSQGVTEIERFDLIGADNFDLTLDPTAVANLSNTSNNLSIIGGADDTVNLAGDWQFVIDDGTFVVFDSGAMTVTISNEVNVLFPDNNAPIAEDDDFLVNEDEVLFGNVLDANPINPDDDPDFDTLFVDTVPVVDVANGVLTLNEDGSFEYTPDADFNGVDSFEYEITDKKDGFDTAIVTITVDPVNDDPVAQDDDFTVFVNETLNGDVLDDNGNGPDFDVDGDNLTVDAVPIIDVANGVLNLNTDGTFTYTPNNGFIGQDTFSYLLEDGSDDGNDVGVVFIDVTPANAPPIARDDIFFAQAGAVLNGNVRADNGNGIDIDPEGDPTVVSIVAGEGPSQGILTIAAGGAFTYVSDEEARGEDTFTYQIDDGVGGPSQAQVTINLSGVPTLLNTAGNDLFNGDGTSIVSYQGAPGDIFLDMSDNVVRGAGVGVDQLNQVFEVIATDFDDILFGATTNPSQPNAYTVIGAFESFIGNGGDDLIFGDAGGDRVSYASSQSGVTVDLLSGFATEDGFGGVDTIFGVEGVKGSNFNDVLRGNSGNNFFQPLRGNDFVDGRGGVNALIYQGVNDNIDIDLQAETATFDNGDVDAIRNIQNVETNFGEQRIVGTGEANMFAAGKGDDFLIGDGGDDTLFGEQGNDRLFGNAGNDVLDGGAGDDELDGSNGSDALRGGTGNDLLQGMAGADNLQGFAGSDILEGGNGDDVIFGNAGEDELFGGVGDDQMFGGGFNDRLEGEDGNDILDGGDQDDILIGYSGSDTLLGDTGNDRLEGGAGSDSMHGGAGADVMLGGNGADTMFGDAGNDQMNGGAGEDEMSGGGFSDRLNGSTGNDRLSGGAASDIFDFDLACDQDTILDFQLGVDKIDVIDFGITNFAELQNILTENLGGSAVLRLNGTTDVVRLAGIDRNDLDANDFLFA